MTKENLIQEIRNLSNILSQVSNDLFELRILLQIRLLVFYCWFSIALLFLLHCNLHSN